MKRHINDCPICEEALMLNEFWHEFVLYRAEICTSKSCRYWRSSLVSYQPSNTIMGSKEIIVRNRKDK